MALIGAQPLEGAPGWTLLSLDDGRELPVEDPTGEFLERGRMAVSPGAMRGSGGFGADQRTAQNAEGQAYSEFGEPLPGVAAGAPTRTLGQVAVDVAKAPFDASISGQAKHEQPAPAAMPQTSGAQSTGTPAPADEGPSFVVQPGTRGGWRETLRSTVGVDLSPEALKRVEDQLAPEFDAYQSSIDTTDEARRNQNISRQVRFNDAQMREEQKTVALNGARAKAERDATKAAHDVRRWTDEKVDPGQQWGNLGFALSAAIGGFAATLLDIKAQRRGGKGGSAGAFWNDIWGMVQNNINEQSRSITTHLNEAKERFGSAEAGRAALEAKIARSIDSSAAAAQKLAETQEEALGYDALRSLAQAELKTKMREAVNQYLPKVSSQSQNVPGTPGRLMFEDEALLQKLNLKQEDLRTWGQSKLTGGEGAVTVNQGLAVRANLQRDLPVLEQLFGGGVNPDRVAVNKLSERAQAVLQAAGIKVSADGTAPAREVRQIMKPIVYAYGKELFGVLNEGQAEAAKDAVGKTPEEQLSFVRRRHTDVDNLLRRNAATTFGQKAPYVVDLAQKAYRVQPASKATGEPY